MLPGYTNGQKYLYEGGAERKTYSDLDASWSHRSAVSAREAGRLLRLQAPRAVCAETSLPLAWRMETAKAAESSFAVPLLMR